MRTLRSGVPPVSVHSQRLAWNKGEVERWNEARGSITRSVYGNRVDYYVSLESWASRLFAVLVWLGAICFSVVFWHIVYAFFTGRVAAVLHHIVSGGLQ